MRASLLLCNEPQTAVAPCTLWSAQWGCLEMMILAEECAALVIKLLNNPTDRLSQCHFAIKSLSQTCNWTAHWLWMGCRAVQCVNTRICRVYFSVIEWALDQPSIKEVNRLLHTRCSFCSCEDTQSKNHLYPFGLSQPNASAEPRPKTKS